MLLPGSINDQSWNATGYAGLMKLKELGYEVAYSENVPAADHVEAMRDYARRGFKIVIGHSGRFLSAAQRVGPEFPDRAVRRRRRRRRGRERHVDRITTTSSSAASSACSPRA